MKQNNHNLVGIHKGFQRDLVQLSATSRGKRASFQKQRNMTRRVLISLFYFQQLKGP